MNKARIFSGRIIFLILIAVLSFKISLVMAAPGDIKWKYPLSDSSCYTLTIGQNNVIYAPSGNYMLAINPNGTLRWSFKTGGTVNTPSVDPANGNIYFQSDDGVYSLNSSGEILWLYMPDDFWPGSDCGGRIAIDSDSTIYATKGGGELHAIDSNGQIKWITYGNGTPSINKDGILYGKKSRATCILNKLDGTQTTCATTDNYSQSPTIGLNDEIYVAGDTRLVALNSNLDFAWDYTAISFAGPPGQAVIDSGGVIYYFTWNHSVNKQFLHAINPDGTQKWILELIVPSGSPAVGNDGVIYAAAATGASDPGLMAIDNMGTPIWFLSGDTYVHNWCSPVIGSDGTVYIIGKEREEDGLVVPYLFAIETSSTGPAMSSWPMMGANAQHTYRVGSMPPPNTTIIAQAPMSGPPGTTFTQWGTGFSPNSVGTLYTRNPDGSEHLIREINLDEIGHFEIQYNSSHDKEPGTYTWWVVDGPSGIKSNDVSYEITEPQPAQVTLTLSLDPQTAGGVVVVPPDEVCDMTCVYTYDSGTQVELTASANEGWNFECWNDGVDCISTSRTFKTVMDKDKTLTARFVDNQIQPRRYFALLVGVNNNIPDAGLDWIWGKNNLPDLKKALLKCSNWKEENIITLSDGDATKDKIFDEIRKIGPLKPNDLFLFYFNGHGYQPLGPDSGLFTPKKAWKKLKDFFLITGSDTPWDEVPFDEDKDLKDEWLVTYGEKRDDWIRDDELQGLFQELKIPNVVAIIQSCFSYGVADDILRLSNVSILASAAEDAISIRAPMSDYVIKSIKKFADSTEGDDELSVGEIYKYLLNAKPVKFWDRHNWPIHKNNPTSADQIICTR